MSKFLKDFKNYLNISNVAPFSRRCFVKNGFDGAMTALGIVIGAYISSTTNSLWIISAGITVSIAMGLSGFFGAYITEESERSITLNNLEKSMLKKLDKSIIGRAEKFATLWVALIDGLSPFIIAMISLIPFILSVFNLLPLFNAFYSSIGITLIILFSLGVYLGKTSKKNIIVCGLKMFFVGLLLTIISFVFKIAV